MATLFAPQAASQALLGLDLGWGFPGEVVEELKKFSEGLWKVALALLLVGLAMLLSRAASLGLERDMAYSIGRALVQLSAVGFVLEVIFLQAGWRGYLCIFLAFCAMVGVAGFTAGTRAKGVPHARQVATAAMFCGCGTTLCLLMAMGVFEVTPQYLVPISGMMVGNSMTVEAALALGATPWQAVQQSIRRSATIALAPVLDSTKTVGLISLPGAMTGLIMGGASVFEATHLQLVVLNFIIGAATFSSCIAIFVSWAFFFSLPGYQLRRELLLAA
eukprot:jgi/Mesen1/8979/ME000056S08383